MEGLTFLGNAVLGGPGCQAEMSLYGVDKLFLEPGPEPGALSYLPT